MATPPSTAASPPAIAHPAIPLVDAERARRFLAAAGVDLLCVKDDEHLYYLSGYFQFYDKISSAVFAFFFRHFKINAFAFALYVMENLALVIGVGLLQSFYINQVF